VLKAGGAYVPLDPSYPKERFDLLLADTQTPVILTQRALSSKVLAGSDVPRLYVDDLDKEAFANEANPLPLTGPRSLAYVMYTSGSTGRPKGVMVENRSVVRLVRNTNFCDFGVDQVFLQFAPTSFDASTLEIWGPLLNGGRLVVMPPSTSSLEELGRVIREQRVTTLWLTAGLFNLMIEQRLSDLHQVRQLVAGGDVLSPRYVGMALDHLPNCSLINGYGPTENTTFTCCHTMHAGDKVQQSVPIGRPISNTQVYILDEQLRPVKVGETGELYAGGDGLARGYLNNPDATNANFVPNHFVPDADARMYRTGDLARWREDGVIEFLGRVDSQVKILGNRIEPGEVETVLNVHQHVKQACVVAHADESGSKRLVAYYVPLHNPNPSPRELRAYLLEKLPHYMIPALFVQLDSMPLSPNGKLDRAALPAPVFLQDGDSSKELPSTQLEQLVSDIWKRILRIDRAGLDDNFFDLGGDSLLLLAVHFNLQKTTRTEIPVTDLFEFTTVRTLAAHLGQSQSATSSFSAFQHQGQKQREAMARARKLRAGRGV